MAPIRSAARGQASATGEVAMGGDGVTWRDEAIEQAAAAILCDGRVVGWQEAATAGVDAAARTLRQRIEALPGEQRWTASAASGPWEPPPDADRWVRMDDVLALLGE